MNISSRTYLIAEIGVNHNGCIDTAKKLILAAKNAKVDAVKFQTFHAEDLVSVGAKKANYQYEYDLDGKLTKIRFKCFHENKLVKHFHRIFLYNENMIEIREIDVDQDEIIWRNKYSRR